MANDKKSGPAPDCPKDDEDPIDAPVANSGGNGPPPPPPTKKPPEVEG